MDASELSQNLKDVSRQLQLIEKSVNSLETKYTYVEKDFRERVVSLTQEMGVLAAMVRNGLRDRLREVEHEIKEMKQALAERETAHLQLRIEKTKGFWLFSGALATALVAGVVSLLLQIIG